MRTLAVTALVLLTTACGSHPVKPALWHGEGQNNIKTACAGGAEERRLCFTLEKVDGKPILYTQFTSVKENPLVDLDQPFILLIDGQQASHFQMRSRDISKMTDKANINATEIKWGQAVDQSSLLPRLRRARQVTLTSGGRILLSVPADGLPAALAGFP